MKRIKLAHLVLVGMPFLTAGESQAGIMWSGSEVRPTAVSGYPGKISRLEFGVDKKQGLNGMEWHEENNIPCKISIWSKNLDGDADTATVGDTLGQCFNQWTSSSVSFAENPRFFVRGIATCGSKVSNNKKRIKGIKIVAAKIWQTKNQIDALGTSASEHRPNCEEPWHDAVYCDDGWVASGLDVHRDKKDANAIVGLALRCRQVGRGSGAIRSE